MGKIKMKIFMDHLRLLCIFIVLLFTGRWGDLKNFYEFLKEPENLSIEEADFVSIEEADFEVYYPDLDEDFWGED
jgi:hypothetical protein